MGRKPLLEKEQVLVAIQRWLSERGVPPSVEELRRELGVGSTRTVLRYLLWLEKDGAIARGGGARAIRLLKPRTAGVQTRAVPLVGQVPAGPLMLAEENIEGWIRVPKSFASPASDRFFLLHVRGNSMNRARVGTDHIEDGDLILVRQRSAARAGDIVVALIDGEATIKQFGVGHGYYVLKPKSTDARHKPIIVDKDFRVLGTVTRVLKKGSELLNLLEG